MVTVEELMCERYIITIGILQEMGLDEFMAEPVAFWLCRGAVGMA